MIYRFGAFTLDTLTYDPRREGEAVHVEPQVFSVCRHGADKTI